MLAGSPPFLVDDRPGIGHFQRGLVEPAIIRRLTLERDDECVSVTARPSVPLERVMTAQKGGLVQ